MLGESSAANSRGERVVGEDTLAAFHLLERLLTLSPSPEIAVREQPGEVGIVVGGVYPLELSPFFRNRRGKLGRECACRGTGR